MVHNPVATLATTLEATLRLGPADLEHPLLATTRARLERPVLATTRARQAHPMLATTPAVAATTVARVSGVKVARRRMAVAATTRLAAVSRGSGRCVAAPRRASARPYGSRPAARPRRASSSSRAPAAARRGAGP